LRLGVLLNEIIPLIQDMSKANEPSASPRTILLVDDQDGNRIMTKWFLNHFGYTVESARSAEEALAMFDPRVHDLVVTDNSMPGMSGAEMSHVIKLRSASTPVVMLTSAPPSDESCLDLVLIRPMHLMRLKEALDGILVGPTVSSAAEAERPISP
jgi:CheY-like chemotaxis protein